MTALTDAQLSAAISQLLTERSTPSYRLSEMGDEDKKMFLSEIGQQTPGSNRLIRSAYTVLDLQSHFTAGVKEAHAWTGHMGDQGARRRQRPAGAGSAVSRSAVDLFQHNRRI